MNDPDIPKQELNETPVSPEHRSEKSVESTEPATPPEPNQTTIETEVQRIDENIKQQRETIGERTEGVQKIRQELNLPPTKESIPIVDQARENIK
jgi:hypothetical protein